MICLYQSSICFLHKDVDECGEENGGCAQLCHNEAGAHTCNCQVGYALAADRKSCIGRLNSNEFS